jgi:hypothetical protein
MTIRESAALVLLYEACLMARNNKSRNAVRKAVEYVPLLREYGEVVVDFPVPVYKTFPFPGHRTMDKVIEDENK